MSHRSVDCCRRRRRGAEGGGGGCTHSPLVGIPCLGLGFRVMVLVAGKMNGNWDWFSV